MAHYSQTDEFERLLRDLSRSFSQPSLGEVSSVVYAALEQVAEFLSLDAAALIRFSDLGQAALVQAVWWAPRLQEPAVESAEFKCPWIIGQIAQGKVLYVPDLETLPAKAQEDRITFARYDIRSPYAVLLFDNPQVMLVVGAMQPGRQLTAKSLDRTQILGQILVSYMLQIEREQRLNATIEAAEVGLWSLDINSMTYLANERTRTLHGFNATEEINLEKLTAAIYSDDREMIHRKIEQVLTSPDEFRVDYRVALSDGVVRWLAARGRISLGNDGKPLQINGMCADITTRKQAEESVKDSAAFNQAVLTSLQTHIAILNRSGTIIAVNEAWTNFARMNNGVSSGCGVGVNYLEVCQRATSAEDGTARFALDGIRSVLESKRELFELEYPCPSPTESRWFLMRVVPLKASGGGAVVTHMDITMRKLAEEELRNAKALTEAVFDSVPGLLYLYNEDGRLIRWNKQHEVLTGYTAEELINFGS